MRHLKPFLQVTLPAMFLLFTSGCSKDEEVKEHIPFEYQKDEQFSATIPILDLNEYKDENTRHKFIAKMKDALQNVGFFAVVNHGVDIECLDRALDAATLFFHADETVKLSALDPQSNGQRGYVLSERAKGQTEKDYKEFFHFGKELSDEVLAKLKLQKNIWPEQVNIKDSFVTLYKRLEEHMGYLQEALAESIDMPKDYFVKMTKNGDNLFRAIHYPEKRQDGQIWAAAHTDIDLFTILPCATSDGLQILNREGEWIPVKVPQNAFIINSGDMLEHLTNGYYISPKHRVIEDDTPNERFSMVFYIHPERMTKLDPLDHMIAKTGGKKRYAGCTAKELLLERLADLGLANKEFLRELGESGFLERQIEIGRESPQAMQAVRKAGYASPSVWRKLREYEWSSL